MIGKAIIGRSFGGAVRYLLDEKKSPEIMESQGLSGSDKQTITQEFNLIRKQNPKLGNAVWHAAISFAHQDKPSDNQLREIAREYLQEMGLNESQYMVVRHHDTQHEHLHILANRVDFEGKTVSDKFCKGRTAAFCDKMEQKYSFAVSKEQGNKRKEAISKTIDAAIKQGKGFGAIAQDIERTGFEIVYNKTSTGNIRGISFKDKEKPEIIFKASDIGRQYSYASIEKRIVQEQVQKQVQQRRKGGLGL
jgi:hypothetical protein